MFEVSYTDLTHLTVTFEHPGHRLLAGVNNNDKEDDDEDLDDFMDVDMMMSVDISLGSGGGATCDIGNNVGIAGDGEDGVAAKEVIPESVTNAILRK